MRLIFLFLASFMFLSPSQAIDWFCKDGYHYYRIASYKCSEIGKGSVYSRKHPSTLKFDKYGEFNTRGGRILITFQGGSGKKYTIDGGPSRQTPEVLTPVVFSKTRSSETTNSKSYVTGESVSSLSNDYPPRTASFSKKSGSLANQYTNAKWLATSTVDQATYLLSKYSVLTKAHGLRFTNEVLVCKAFRESMGKYNGKKIFQTQRETPSKRSSAAGISQVTESTAKDQLNRGKWFRSKVPGFENIRNGKEFHRRMAGNMVAQMELGMAVLEQKRRDGGFKTVKSTLSAYYGSRSKTCNNYYATKILSCEACLKGGVTVRCLDKALGNRKGC